MARVLFLTRLYEPHVGGVEKHVKNISKRLVKKGNKVTVLTTKHEAGLSESEMVDGVEIKRFERPQIKFLGLISTWIWLFKNRHLFREADVIHCHDVFIWYLPFKYIYPNKKVYTTFHGWDGKFPIPTKNILFKRLAANLSDKNICVGEYVEKYYNIKADLITYGATDTPDPKLNKKPKQLVYVGRLDRDTGLETLLRTLDKLEGYSVDFCGDGPLTGKCSEYGKVHGFVDPSRYLSKAKIAFVGGYLSTLEAFAHKCVAVAAYENNLRKDYFQMTPFIDWMIFSNDPNKLAEQISGVSNSKDMYKNMVDEAFAWTSKQTWENLLKEYLHLWQTKS